MTAVYPGSFDPVTYGHIDIIRRASSLFDELVVGVIVNPAKTPLFTKEERVEMIREVTSDCPNVQVECFQGLLADYVNAGHFDAVVRGLRGIADFDYEFQMSQINAKLYLEGTETVFLMADPRYSFISSSMVREVASLGGSIESLVPEPVRSRTQAKYQR